MKLKRIENNVVQFLLIVYIGVILTGCVAPVWKEPMPVNEVDFKAHARTMVKDDITVTVAVPGREETKALFGTSLYSNKIQPVWIEVDNQSNHNYILMKIGIDRMSYSPLEASYQRHSISGDSNLDMDKFFFSRDFKNPVLAGKITSGFVFTTLDEGHKSINIDLVGNNDLKTYSFVVKVPGILTDASLVDFKSLYDQWVDINDEQKLREILASLPCCTVNESGEQNGDPLNVVMIGKMDHIFSALIRSGWQQTEITYGKSILKTVKSFLFGSQYFYSPISPLYVFGRQQDVGLQKARGNISLRNHMRLWRTQYNYKGKDVYLGQISRDIGVKFNSRTFTTHIIDPDVDSTRDSLVGDLAYSQALIKFGFTKGSQVSTMQDTHYNLTPDPYYSDGYRVVMFFDERPTTLDNIELLNWEKTELNAINKVPR